MSGPARAALGRADLLDALVAGEPQVADFIAAELGLRRGEPAGKRDAPPTETQPATPSKAAADPQRQAPAYIPSDARFWQPLHWESFGDDPETATAPIAAFSRWRSPPSRPPHAQPLATWSELAPRLRQVLSDHREGRALDLERTIRWISRGRILTRFPRQRRRRWGPALMLLDDDARHLVPFRADRRMVRRALRRLLPAHALGHAAWRPHWPQPQAQDDSALPWPPPPGTLVLALGDLGALAAAGQGRQAAWLALGQQLQADGCWPLALFPGPLARCPPLLADLWGVLPWERPRPDDGQTPEQRAERLLRLLAMAGRIEPGLLRGARLLLPPDQADAGTEADVWQHPALDSGTGAIAGIDLGQARALREACIRDDPPELRRGMLRLIKAWRHGLPEEIWFDELLSADPLARAPSLDDPGLEDLSADISDARAYFKTFCTETDPDRPDTWASGDDDWFERVRTRATCYLWQEPGIGKALAARADGLLQARLRRGEAVGSDAIAADGIDTHGRVAETWQLVQQGARLIARAPEQAAPPSLSPIITIRAAAGRLDLIPFDDFWTHGQAPSWAARWGEDEHGPWVVFEVRPEHGPAVAQRMRWMPPGELVMGSPEDEPGRWDDEGPQHRVRIADGFWLFDTPCTQALWQAVMGRNPSRFQDPERPVEQVSWDEVQAFIPRLNERVPGLGLGLPSEAQWEYACRGGTDQALYSGPIEILGDNNVPALDPIAWYGGNSGVAYDLDEAEKPWWTERQYESDRAGSRKVQGKAPNPWGLYDMLGNVWEWTRDRWHSDYANAPENGSAWETGDDAVRVVRGGSWFFVARDCRCASRRRFQPGVRVNYLGFRCARVQGEFEPGQEQVSGAPSRPVGTPRGADRGRAVGPARRAAGGRVLLLGADAETLLPKAPALLIRGDREQLQLRRITQPSWASAIGRDRFGLWAELGIDGINGIQGQVIQRLRWIPPGRFTLGSPEDEPGRFSWEGPQQQVSIADGFWLFDTPCTQALWRAVMDANPSRFQDPLRPVETVSWADAQAFIQRINDRVEHLHLSLPSEARWEYACRAGTDTALYTGPIDIKGDAPALDPIAWYGGNSAHGFELDNGVDLSYLEQRAHTGKAGTRRVKAKAPNPWGLYDMLGNVWEWVEDGWHNGHEGAPNDGSARPPGSDADRVVRGGSWNFKARNCRCATRLRVQPGVRDSDLGFRCARVQP